MDMTNIDFFYGSGGTWDWEPMKSQAQVTAKILAAQNPVLRNKFSTGRSRGQTPFGSLNDIEIYIFGQYLY